MIVSFSVQNFGSIKEKQTLSFEADKSKHLEEHYVVEKAGLRLLKLALIYGANASGKTTVLKALDFLRSLVLSPKDKKTDELNFQPFLFDPLTPHENTLMSIEFIQNELRYFYEVVFTTKAIVSEELYCYNPTKANIFKRTTDLEKQFTEISFGAKTKKNIEKGVEKILSANTLWNNTVLGGFLKTNVELTELKLVADWFGKYLTPIVNDSWAYESFVTHNIEKSPLIKGRIISLLKKADLNISDIILQEPDDLPDEIVSMLKSSSVTDKQIANIKNTLPNRVMLEHQIDGEKYTLPFLLESDGTRRYYGLVGILNDLIVNPFAFPIDELESSLHPDLYIHFLLTFLVNAKGSQIIATTHNREILNNKDIFRNDAIWFTDKSENCATKLYSLADFDTTVVRDTTNILNAYKSGKLGGAPNLGDYFMDVQS